MLSDPSPPSREEGASPTAPHAHLQKGVLNLLKLLLVCALHLIKLPAHVLQQRVDVLRLALERLDELIVLLLELALDVCSGCVWSYGDACGGYRDKSAMDQIPDLLFAMDRLPSRPTQHT